MKKLRKDKKKSKPDKQTILFDFVGEASPTLPLVSAPKTVARNTPEVPVAAQAEAIVTKPAQVPKPAEPVSRNERSASKDSAKRPTPASRKSTGRVRASREKRRGKGDRPVGFMLSAEFYARLVFEAEEAEMRRNEYARQALEEHLTKRAQERGVTKVESGGKGCCKNTAAPKEAP